MSACLAAILGCEGLQISAWERDFFREADPLGFILFARNISSPEQVRALTQELRDLVGREEAPILIDQEGGRVQRLRPPEWLALPPNELYGKLAEVDWQAAMEAVALQGALLAEQLLPLGINVDCWPCMDLRFEGAHDVIGDRAFSADPAVVRELAEAGAEALRAGGVIPVVKHLPGHGRAGSDSHKELPRVDVALSDLEESDFRPFKNLPDHYWGMTAHILYPALDEIRPITQSARGIQEILRGQLAFEGFLVSDDLSMEALEGSFDQRAAQSLSAGCDAVLHCNAKPLEMEAVIKGSRALDAAAMKRLQRSSLSLSRGQKQGLSVRELYGELCSRLARVGWAPVG